MSSNQLEAQKWILVWALARKAKKKKKKESGDRQRGKKSHCFVSLHNWLRSVRKEKRKIGWSGQKFRSCFLSWPTDSNTMDRVRIFWCRRNFFLIRWKKGGIEMFYFGCDHSFLSNSDEIVWRRTTRTVFVGCCCCCSRLSFELTTTGDLPESNKHKENYVFVDNRPINFSLY